MLHILPLTILLCFAFSSASIRSFDSVSSEEEQEGAQPSPSFCATLPPPLWCACEKVQEQCGTKQKCQEYASAARNQPVHITLLFESLCSDCQDFISKSLFNVYQRYKNKYLRVELVPFGNAKLLQNGSIQCQHGPEECRINKFESCAIHFMHEPLPFIHCLETKIANGTSLEKASKQCYSHPLPHIFDQITHCFNGPKGDQLQKIDAQKTASIWPDQHEYVPWILVNNASLQSQQFLMNNLQTLICQSYVGDKEAELCQPF